MVSPQVDWQLHVEPHFWSHVMYVNGALEETLKAIKAIKMIDWMTLGKKCLLTRLPPFSKYLKGGNLPV